MRREILETDLSAEQCIERLKEKVAVVRFDWTMPYGGCNAIVGGVPTPWGFRAWPHTGFGPGLTAELEIANGAPTLVTMTMRMKYPADTDVTVEYRPDEKLGMWVPSKMDESYDMPSTKIRCAATYSNFRRFQVNTEVTIGNPKDEPGE